MDKNELKVQALLERIGNLTASYESKIADLRVEITQQAELIGQLAPTENEGESE